MKIILDTNILVSALISTGFPSKVLNEALFNKNIFPCFSNSTFEEYQEVLARPKFSRFPDFIENSFIVLAQLRNKGVFFNLTQSVNLLKDKSDNKFLELAFESKAEFLITGNTLDFTLSSFDLTQIISPKDFIEINFPNS
jgi:putative PIN family toxin of toxin-antitoxin system